MTFYEERIYIKNIAIYKHGMYYFPEKIPCTAVTCLNGATCTDTDSGHRCECVIGFTGDKCETGKYGMGDN